MPLFIVVLVNYFRNEFSHQSKFVNSLSILKKKFGPEGLSPNNKIMFSLTRYAGDLFPRKQSWL